MNVWVVTIYEPLPLNDPGTRPQRCGMLLKALCERGHQVELWTSSFEHVLHVHMQSGSDFFKVNELVSIQYLHGCGYAHDSSPKRMIHNRQTAKEFTRIANSRAVAPDIIFAPVPTLELAEAAVNYAKTRNIPIVVDIRDLWPDVYMMLFPEWVRPVVRPAFYFETRRAQRVFRRATGITAISKTYMEWGLRHARRDQRPVDSVFHLGFTSDFCIEKERQGSSASSIATRYGITDDDFIVTFVGTFSGFYDVLAILKAARCFKNDKRVRFFVVGTGDKSEEFRRISEELPNVVMTGWVDFQTVRAILSFTNVGLVAYSKDATMSLPNKPFEYMAAGLPLLSSLPGELEQLIIDNHIGRTYQAGNPESLANELLWFLNHADETKKMGERAHQLYESTFKSDIIYKKFAEYLERMSQHHV